TDRQPGVQKGYEEPEAAQRGRSHAEDHPFDLLATLTVRGMKIAVELSQRGSAGDDQQQDKEHQRVPAPWVERRADGEQEPGDEQRDAGGSRRQRPARDKAPVRK